MTVPIVIAVILLVIFAIIGPPKCECGGEPSWWTVKPPYHCSKCGRWYIW